MPVNESSAISLSYSYACALELSSTSAAGDLATDDNERRRVKLRPFPNETLAFGAIGTNSVPTRPMKDYK